VELIYSPSPHVDTEYKALKLKADAQALEDRLAGREPAAILSPSITSPVRSPQEEKPALDILDALGGLGVEDGSTEPEGLGGVSFLLPLLKPSVVYSLTDPDDPFSSISALRSSRAQWRRRHRNENHRPAYAPSPLLRLLLANTQIDPPNPRRQTRQVRPHRLHYPLNLPSRRPSPP
jgi:hypothetical protein